MRLPSEPLRLPLLAFVLAACGGERASPPAQEPAAAPEAQEPRPASSTFARLVETGDDEGRFETAITTYEDEEGRRVSLVAAVHIADPAHYGELQAELDEFETVLYELVASPDDRPTPGEPRASGSPVSFLQRAMTRGLQLAFQLDAMDYDREHFVHADLTPRGFEEAMEERGQTILDQFLGIMSRQMRQMREAAEEAEGEEADQTPVDLVSAFQRREGRHALRMLFARQLSAIEGLVAGPEDDDTVLLEGRNERALEVLRGRLAAGDSDLAIYYGAAHLPGIEKALVEDLGFTKTGERWLVAWDLRRRPDDAGPVEGEAKRPAGPGDDR